MSDKFIKGDDDMPENVAKAMFRLDPTAKRKTKSKVMDLRVKTDKVVVIREVAN